MKVLFIWNVRAELRSYLEGALPDMKMIYPCPVGSDDNFETVTEDMYLPYASEADVIVGWRPSKELLLAASNMKLFINPGAGVQHITDLFLELREEGRDIPLANGHGNAYFTATGAVGLLLSFMNKIIIHHNWMVDGNWRFLDDKAKTIPLRDRKIGFLGFGHVSQHVHLFLSNFRLEFHALRKDWSKYNDDGPTQLVRYGPDELAEFLREIDILFISLPSTKDTIGLIGKAELALLGSNGILVQTGRGDIVDEKALFTALKDRSIAGAAIDVWYDYRPEEDEEGRKYPYNQLEHPFHELDNIVMSPHRCASPFDDLERWNEVIENIKRVRDGSTDYLNIVDIEAGY